MVRPPTAAGAAPDRSTAMAQDHMTNLDSNADDPVSRYMGQAAEASCSYPLPGPEPFAALHGKGRVSLS